MKNFLAVLALCTLSIGQTAVLPNTTLLPKTTIWGSVATGGPSAITLVQSNGVAGAAGTSQPVTLSSSVAGGDLLKLVGMWGNTIGTMTVSDNATGCTNTWHATPSSPSSDGNSNEVFDWWTVNCGTQAGGLTITMAVASGGSHTIREGAFQYHSTTGWPTSPIDKSNAGISSSPVTTGNPGSITPTTANSLITAVIEVTSAITAASFSVTPCTEENAGGSVHTGFGSATRTQGADILSGTTSATTCTWTWTGSIAYSALISNYTPN